MKLHDDLPRLSAELLSGRWDEALEITPDELEKIFQFHWFDETDNTTLEDWRDFILLRRRIMSRSQKVE